MGFAELVWCRVGARSPWVSLGTPLKEVNIYCETDHSLERINLILRLDPPSVSHTFLFAELSRLHSALRQHRKGGEAACTVPFGSSASEMLGIFFIKLACIWHFVILMEN